MDVLQSYPPSVSSSPFGKDVIRVIDLDGRVDPAHDPRLELDQVRAIYRGMVRTRLIDERLTALQRQGRIGFHVGALGEEGCVVASAAAMREQDWLFPCYREVGAALYRGMPLQTYIDNVFGNANDVVQGRQMPDHVTAKAYHYGSVTSPIGTQIPQAVGFAMAAKYRRQDVVAGVYFGDGATSANDFHSGMNFAGVFHAPVVFLLRNNGWAISVPIAQQTASATLADKGAAYGVRAARCDGNDPLAVYATVHRAVQRAAAGKGPTLVEMVTYRMGAHSTSDDPTAYRSDEDVQEHKKGDPIERLRLYLEGRGGWSQQDDERLRQELSDELNACIEEAERTPQPPISSMFHDVFREQPQHLREQQHECERGPRARKPH